MKNWDPKSYPKITFNEFVIEMEKVLSMAAFKGDLVGW
jgi:hypothetical protein